MRLCVDDAKAKNQEWSRMTGYWVMRYKYIRDYLIPGPVSGLLSALSRFQSSASPASSLSSPFTTPSSPLPHLIPSPYLPYFITPSTLYPTPLETPLTGEAVPPWGVETDSLEEWRWRTMEGMKVDRHKGWRLTARRDGGWLPRKVEGDGHKGWRLTATKGGSWQP